MLSILSTETVLETDRGAGASWTGLQWDGSHGNCVYLVGGRENLYMGDKLDRTWKHSGAVMEYCSTRKGVNAWRFLANLTSPVSDGCAADVDSQLWLVGGEAGVSLLDQASHKWDENVA